MLVVLIYPVKEPNSLENWSERIIKMVSISWENRKMQQREDSIVWTWLCSACSDLSTSEYVLLSGEKHHADLRRCKLLQLIHIPSSIKAVYWKDLNGIFCAISFLARSSLAAVEEKTFDTGVSPSVSFGQETMIKPWKHISISQVIQPHFIFCSTWLKNGTD